MAGGSLTATSGTPRIKLRGELGKGVQALRAESVFFSHSVAGALTFTRCLGPWPVDIDVKDIEVTAAVKLTDNNSNTLDVFNGTVVGAKTITPQLDHTALNALTAQVAASQAITAANARVPKGTVITVRLVAAGSDGSTPADVTVRVEYDIPVYDQTAVITTYGAYDDGE